MRCGYYHLYVPKHEGVKSYIFNDILYKWINRIGVIILSNKTKGTMIVLINIIITVYLCCISSMVVNKTWWTVFSSLLTAAVVYEDLVDLFKLYKK